MRIFVAFLLFSCLSTEAQNTVLPFHSEKINIPAPKKITLNKPVKAIPNYAFKVYDPENGLSQSHIKCMIQDKHGRLWIGSDGGVTIFNGKNFTTYTKDDGLPNDVVTALLEFSDGTIGIGTNNGYTVFDGYRFKNEIIKNQDGFIVRDIYEANDGTIWTATTHGIFKKENGKWIKQFTNILTEEEVNTRVIFGDQQGGIWFGAYNKVILLKNGVPSLQYVAEEPLSARISDIQQDAEGNIWVTVFNKGLVKITAKENKLYPAESDLSNEMTKLYLAKDNSLWIGSNHGIIIKKGDHIETITTENGLPTNAIQCFLEDAEHNIWIGTHGGGVMKFINRSFTHYIENSGIADPTALPILETKNRGIWIGTKEGIAIFKDNTFVNITAANGLIASSISGLFEDSRGRIWVAAKEGISIIDGNLITNLGEAAGFKDKGVCGFVEDDEGRIWMASHKNIMVLDSNVVYFPDSTEGTIKPLIRDVMKDKYGRIWMAVRGGVAMYDGKTFHRENEYPSVFKKEVFSLGIDEQDRLWVGTYDDGIFILKDNKELFHLSSNNGLLNKSVVSLVVGDGRAWIGTNHGLSRVEYGKINGRGFEVLENGMKIRNYIKDNGFEGMECNQNSLLVSRSGELWVGAANRATRFDYASEKINAMEPNTVLNSFKLFYNEVNWNDVPEDIIYENNVANNGEIYPDKVELSYKKNHITIGFYGSSLNYPEKNTFKYRMLGQSDEWSPRITNNEVIFPFLNPGEYRFEVISSNNEGVWDQTPAILQISINPPWWKTLWFRLIGTIGAIVLIGGIFYYFFRQRQQRLMQEHETIKLEQRLLRSQMNPHFIFNSLNAIQSFIYASDSEQAGAYLGKFSKLIRLVLENSRSEFISIEKELTLLTLYVELQQLRLEKQFVFNVHLEPNISTEAIGIPPMLAQPFIENAIEHGLKNLNGEGRLDIYISQKDDHILFKVEDNGVGLEKSGKINALNRRDHQSLATKITKERLYNFNRERAKGDKLTVKIEDISSEKGTGTRVEFTIPITDL